MIIGVQITKLVSFRGADQEFHNVYHYNLDTAVTAPAEAIVDEIVTMERGMHSTDVEFVRAAVWSAGGSPAQNQMLHQEVLTGNGTEATITDMDRERAILIQWPAGVDVRGKPVYLRKWYHSCGSAQSVGFAGTVLQNTSQIPAAQRDVLAAHVASVNEVGGTEAWDLCSATGRLWQAQPHCHPYLEHHQLGDMWR